MSDQFFPRKSVHQAAREFGRGVGVAEEFPVFVKNPNRHFRVGKFVKTPVVRNNRFARRLVADVIEADDDAVRFARFDGNGRAVLIDIGQFEHVRTRVELHEAAAVSGKIDAGFPRKTRLLDDSPGNNRLHAPVVEHARVDADVGETRRIGHGRGQQLVIRMQVIHREIRRQSVVPETDVEAAS